MTTRARRIRSFVRATAAAGVALLVWAALSTIETRSPYAWLVAFAAAAVLTVILYASNLRDLERRERDARTRALANPDAQSRREARDAELDAYRAELGEEVDD